MMGWLRDVEYAVRRVRRFFAAAAVVAWFVATATPTLAQPVILGSGPNSVFEHNAVFMNATVGNAAGTAPLFVTVTVQHDAARSLAGLAIDVNYDGVDNTGTVAVTPTTVEMSSETSGISRTSFTITLPNPLGFVGSNARLGVPVRIAAVLDDGSRSASVTGLIDFFANDNVTAGVDFPFIFGQSQTQTEVGPGQAVTFSFQGNDTDTGAVNFTTFSAYAFRVRRLQDGAIVQGPTEAASCGNSCNNNLPLTFPAFGRFVVEAAAAQGNSAGDAAGVFSHPNSFFRIGAVDVNVACGTADDGDAPDEANFGLQFFILPCGDDGDEEIGF